MIDDHDTPGESGAVAPAALRTTSRGSLAPLSARTQARLHAGLARRAGELEDQLRRRADDGMATAEYAIVTLAAVGFAGLLVIILRSPEVRAALSGIIEGALSG